MTAGLRIFQRTFIVFSEVANSLRNFIVSGDLRGNPVPNPFPINLRDVLKRNARRLLRITDPDYSSASFDPARNFRKLKPDSAEVVGEKHCSGSKRQAAFADI